MPSVPEPPSRDSLKQRRLAEGSGRVVMRARTAAVILAAALGLGVVTGRFVLPAPSHSPVATPTVSPPTRSSSSAPPASTGPVTDRNLLAAATFEKVGFSQHLYAQDRIGDSSYANGACIGDKTLGETLAMAQPEAHFRGLMTSPNADTSDPTMAPKIEAQVSREVAGDAGSAALADNFAQRLRLEEVPCQDEPAGHWVFGQAHAVDVAPDIAATWMAYYEGTLNTTGTAPQDKAGCGGFAVLQNGSHYGVLDVHACLDTDAMTKIVSAAVTQL
jgi:hypothetical protein